MNEHRKFDLSCTECGDPKGEIFLCGEGYFCIKCYDEVLKGNDQTSS